MRRRLILLLAVFVGILAAFAHLAMIVIFAFFVAIMFLWTAVSIGFRRGFRWCRGLLGDAS